MAWRLLRRFCVVPLSIMLVVMVCSTATAGGLGIPTRRAGLGFGNSRDFTGVRFNLVDRQVDKVAGLNVTFWIPRDNNHAVYQGVNLGLVALKATTSPGSPSAASVSAATTSPGSPSAASVSAVTTSPGSPSAASVSAGATSPGSPSGASGRAAMT
jgi:hypothetical protein